MTVGKTSWLQSLLSSTCNVPSRTQSPWSLCRRFFGISVVKPSAPPVAKKKPKKRAGDALESSIDTDPLYLQHLFSANVRAVRLARGMSQEELADRASLDRTYISSIERKLRNLSIQNTQRLAVALGVNPRELLDPIGGG